MDISVKDVKITDKKCKIYTLKNATMDVKILNIGATILEINVPNKVGHFDNLVLNHHNMLSYSANPFYFGATLGRTAGRIKGGDVTISGVNYKLANNNAGNTLHGGKRGFSLEHFDELKKSISDEAVTLELYYFSKDKEEGYPGNLKLTVIYTLTKDNEFTIRYKAISDKDTLCSISNHAYFNMNGVKSIMDQSLVMNANHYYDNQGGLIVGKRERVDNTPFDFRVEKKLNHEIDNPLLHVYTNGYDHLFEFNDDQDKVILKDYESGRMMTINTSYNSCQLFTFEFQKRNSFYSGVCFECQKIPYRHGEKNECILKKDEQYDEFISYKFEIMDSLQ